MDWIICWRVNVYPVEVLIVLFLADPKSPITAVKVNNGTQYVPG
jgi:hypothetical protein